MRLIDDWRFVLRRAWSIKLILLSTGLSGLEVAIQVAIAWEIPVPVPAGVFAALAGFVTVAAGLARFIAQSRGYD